MNNPNPFVPQGSLLEQKNKKRARVKMAVLAIFAFNILLISPMLLIQACNRGNQSSQTDNNGLTADTATDLSNNPATTAATIPDMSASNNGTMTAAVPPVPPVQVQTPVQQPPVAAATTYTVVAHDTLATIAKSHNVKLKDLEAANPGVVPTKLSVGKQLNIPAPTMAMAQSTTPGGAVESTSDDTYTVKPGDNLTKIALKNGTSVKAIMDLNKMSSTRINAGEKLKMPAKAAAAATASAAPIDIPAQTTTASNPTAPGNTALR